MKKFLFLAAVTVFQLLAQDKLNELHITPNTNKTATGQLFFETKDKSHWITLTGPPTLSANQNWTLPGNDPGGCWNTDGSGGLFVGPCGGPNSIVIDADHPLIVYVHFADDDKTRIIVSYSFFDGMNFRHVNKNGTIKCLECRDPSITYDYATSQWLIIASPNGLPGGDTGRPQVWKSTDFETWTATPILLNVPGLVSGANAVYAPEFFRDPSTISTALPYGKLFILMPISTNNGTSFTPHAVEYNAATDALVDHTFSIPGSAQGKTYDYFMYYDDTPGAANPYVLALVDQYTPATPDTVENGRYFYEGVSYATSASLIGGTFALSSNTPTNSSSLWTGPGPHPGYFGLGTRAEAPSIMKTPGKPGCLWMWADVWDDLFNNGGSGGNRRHYRVQRVEACGGAPFSAITTPASGETEINVGIAEHGTFLAVSDPALAGQVLSSAAKHAMESGLHGRVVIGDDSFPSYYTATIRSKSAHDFIQSDDAAELAFEGADHQAATIAGCGGGDQFSCPPPVGGLGRLIFQHQGMGGNGAWQFNNTNVQTGQTSFKFCVGCGAFGSNPISDLPESQWDFGMNNLCFGPIASCGNVANNWFFWYSRALGHGTNLIQNAGFESGDFTYWGAGTGTAVLNYSSSPAYVHSGVNSAVLASNNTYIFQTITGLTAGKLYRLTAWVRGDAGGSTPEWLAAQNADASGRVTSDMTFVPSTGWTLLGISITPNSTSISISINRGAGSYQVYVDDLTINAGNTVGAFPLGLSPYDGQVRAGYSYTWGGGDNTSLLQDTWGNIDSIGLSRGFVNIGIGIPGDHNAYVQAGSFGVGNKTGDALFFGALGAEQVQCDSPSLNHLECGDGTPGHNNLIFNIGILDVYSGLRNRGQDLTTGVGTATTWAQPVLTTGQVKGGTVVATAQSYADQFVGRDAQLGSFTLNTTSGDTGIGYAVAFQSGTSYIGNQLSMGNNFTPGSPFACMTAPLANVFHFGDCATANSNNAFMVGGVANMISGFQVNGVAVTGGTGGTNWIGNVAAPGTITAGTSVAAPLGAFTTLLATAALKTNYGGNNDTAGYLTIGAGGTVGYTFGQTYSATYQPVCTATDYTAASALKIASSNTGIVVTGTASHVVGYICIGRL